MPQQPRTRNQGEPARHSSTRPTPARGLRRLGALTAVALAVTVATAGPASGHAEVEAEGARALDLLA